MNKDIADAMWAGEHSAPIAQKYAPVWEEIQKGKKEIKGLEPLIDGK